MPLKKILLLDSRDGTKLNTLDNDGKSIANTSKVRYDLSRAGVSMRNVQRIGVYSVNMPNVFYNITHRNNTFNFDATFTVASDEIGNEFTISPGYYTQSNLLSALEAAANIASTSGSFSFTVDSTTYKLSMSSDTSDLIDFTFNYSASTIGNVLGITADQTSTTKIISADRPIDLRGITTVLLKISGSKASLGSVLTTSPTNTQEYFHNIHIDQPFGSSCFFKASTHLELFEVPDINLSGNIVIELMNRNKESIYLNNFDYRLGLVLEYLE